MYNLQALIIFHQNHAWHDETTAFKKVGESSSRNPAVSHQVEVGNVGPWDSFPTNQIKTMGGTKITTIAYNLGVFIIEIGEKTIFFMVVEAHGYPIIYRMGLYTSVVGSETIILQFMGRLRFCLLVVKRKSRENLTQLQLPNNPCMVYLPTFLP